MIKWKEIENLEDLIEFLEYAERNNVYIIPFKLTYIVKENDEDFYYEVIKYE